MNSFSFLTMGRRLCMAFMVVLISAFSHASEIGVTDKEIIIGQSIACARRCEFRINLAV